MNKNQDFLVMFTIFRKLRKLVKKSISGHLGDPKILKFSMLTHVFGYLAVIGGPRETPNTGRRR